MSLQTYNQKTSKLYNIDTETNKRSMSKIYSKHFDKMDHIAALFENETFTMFDECLSDKAFGQIIIDNSLNDVEDIVKKLCDYAHENLI